MVGFHNYLSDPGILALCSDKTGYTSTSLRQDRPYFVTTKQAILALRFDKTGYTGALLRQDRLY